MIYADIFTPSIGEIEKSLCSILEMQQKKSFSHKNFNLHLKSKFIKKDFSITAPKCRSLFTALLVTWTSDIW